MATQMSCLNLKKILSHKSRTDVAVPREETGRPNVMVAGDSFQFLPSNFSTLIILIRFHFISLVERGRERDRKRKHAKRVAISE